MQATEPSIELVSKISPSRIVKIMKDPVKSARAVKLIYSNDSETEGFTRKKFGKGFAYYLHGKKITDADELARIKQLAIPPAWKDVWICTAHNGHLQATGID
ncbi:MAG TPA: DNA topoisomerase I, partial [Chryseobacterium sp.]|nr:DNA topoisomerase I [Chryseobacterium sp.]